MTADVSGAPSEFSGPDSTFASLAARLAEVAPLLDGALADSTVGERRHAVVTLCSALDRIEAATATVAGVSEDRLDHLLDGARSMVTWICARAETDRPRAHGLLGLHAWVERFDAIATAWRTGVIGTAKVKAVRKFSTGLETELTRDEQALIARIAPLTARHARTVLAHWRNAVLADRDESPDDPRPTDQPVNSIRFGPGVGDETNATTILDPLHAAELRSLIDGEVDRQVRKGTYTTDDGMTLEERRLDAQLQLMRRGALVQTEGGEAKRSVVLLVDVRHLMSGLDVDAVERALWPCGTADGTPLGRQDVLDTLADDPAVTAVLGFYGITGRFRPVGEVTTNRLASASQRRMLKARDHGCMWPGCDTPATRTRAHHEPPFERSKRTTTDELVSLCHHHHRCRHEAGFTIDLHPNGDLTVTRPDGTPLPAEPPGHKLPLREPPPMS
ncbi:MAG: DUF222 domain-containing protein [Actinobacteria bacterium]|nr:DUF222 domain-containing protein [Actinomycetota bacterium]